MRFSYLFLLFLFFSCQPQANTDKPVEVKEDSSSTISNEQEEVTKKLNCLKIKEEVYYDGPNQLTFYIDYSYEGDQLKLSKRYDKYNELNYITEYEYDNQGKLIRELEKDKNGKLDNIGIYKYDKEGEAISFQYSDDDGNLLNSTSYKNTYNEQGKLIKQEIQQNMGANGGLDNWTNEYSYNEKGWIISKLNISNNRKMIYSYNDKGQLLQKTINYEGNTVHKTEYSYDEDGNLKEFRSTDSEGKFFERRVFSYKCIESE